MAWMLRMAVLAQMGYGCAERGRTACALLASTGGSGVCKNIGDEYASTHAAGAWACRTWRGSTSHAARWRGRPGTACCGCRHAAATSAISFSTPSTIGCLPSFHWQVRILWNSSMQVSMAMVTTPSVPKVLAIERVFHP